MRTCEKVGGMIVCSSGRKRPATCFWCDKVSTKLCDHEIVKGRTCDKPMCDHHATRVGQNLDTCPFHTRVEAVGGTPR
jgi:hypothetical protein